MKTQTVVILGVLAVVLYVIYNNMQTVQTVAKQIANTGLPSISGIGDPGQTQVNPTSRNSLGGHFG